MSFQYDNDNNSREDVENGLAQNCSKMSQSTIKIDEMIRYPDSNTNNPLQSTNTDKEKESKLSTISNNANHLAIGSSEDENLSNQSDAPDRGQWSSGVEFLLSCVSMSVGLGNVWRFPYVAYENGGGAFLIPYLILLFVIGRPIYYLELILGQFSGRGPIKVWKCVPAFKGVGFAQLFSVSYIAIFYNYLMGISIFYFISSFSSELPWTKCNSAWVKDDYCQKFPNATNYNNKTWSELYYERTVLNISEGLWDINSISWKLAACLLASWVLVYLSIVKGVTSLGKVSYFTAIFPYVVLIILLCVSVTQEGAIDGIAYFFKPDFEKLLDPIVWYRAVEQSFFSLAVCFGSLTMYSSYNNFSNNVNRDAIIISVLDTVTSLLAGCVIFAVLGAMANENGEDIKDVVKGGTGLAFIAYPEGLSKIKFVPQLWSVLFFFMLFTLGIGSSVAMIETILTCFKDEFPALQRQKGKTALFFCFIFMLLGLPLTTDAGSYIMSLLDNYGVGTAAFLYGILEVIGVAWVYGLKNFCDDIQFMLGNVSFYWKLTWGFITPFVLIAIFFYGNFLIFKESTTVPGIPMWGTGIGWLLAGIALIQIPLWFIITVFRQKGSTLKEKLHLALEPTNDWGPIDEKIFNQWINYKIDKNFSNSSKKSITKTLGLDNEFHKSKLLFFSSNSEANFSNDNMGFVPDESDTSSSAPSQSSHNDKNK